VLFIPTTITNSYGLEFNVDLDESLFSVEPPAGYTVQMTANIDVSPPAEKDLIAAFREYGKLTGGAFPDSLDMQAMMQTLGKMVGMESALQALREKLASGKEKLNEEQMNKLEELTRKMMEWQLSPENAKPSEEEMRRIEDEMRKIGGWEKLAPGPGKGDLEQMRKEMHAEMPRLMEASMKKVVEIQMPVQRGLMFAVGLPREADARYAGKGVSSAAADKPVFWYRPKDALKYRVIYADLSVRETDTPPNVPDAQPVTAPLGPKK
jgi:hypothetical protein